MLIASLEALGRWTQFALATLAAVAVPRFRLRDLLRQFQHIYVGALPLGMVAGVTLGIVIWMHLHGVLARLGSGYTRLLPQALALAVVLEFAPLGAGLIVAGRSGASLGAELGSMLLTEQIDALQALGFSPLRRLVAPRVWACMLALPLLTVAIAFLAMIGSGVAEVVGGTMGWREYWNESLRGLRLQDILPATLKTVVFGYLIGVTGCYFGLNAHGGAESVGHAATRSVVVSFLLVVASNVFLVGLIQLIGW